MTADEDKARQELGTDIWRLVSAAYRAHMAGIHPPSGYCASLLQLPYSASRWDHLQHLSYITLMREAPAPDWNPDSRAFLNWLYLTVRGLQRHRWMGFTVEELKALKAELED